MLLRQVLGKFPRPPPLFAVKLVLPLLALLILAAIAVALKPRRGKLGSLDKPVRKDQTVGAVGEGVPGGGNCCSSSASLSLSAPMRERYAGLAVGASASRVCRRVSTGLRDKCAAAYSRGWNSARRRNASIPSGAPERISNLSYPPTRPNSPVVGIVQYDPTG
jgi:hypothetical protein